jgi:hypothetical protein
MFIVFTKIIGYSKPLKGFLVNTYLFFKKFAVWSK